MRLTSRRLLNVLPVTAAAIALLAVQQLHAQTYVFPVLDDTMFVYHPNQIDDNFGSRNETSVGAFNNDPRDTLLRFDVSAAMAEINDPSLTVVEATLTLNPREERSGIQGTGSAEIGVYGLLPQNDGWFEGTKSGSSNGPTGEFGSVSSWFLATPSSMSNATSDGSPLPDPQVDTDGRYWFSAGGGPTGTPLIETTFDVAADTTNVPIGTGSTGDINIVDDADWNILLEGPLLEPFLAEWLAAPLMDDGDGGMQTSNAGLVLSRISGTTERWFLETNDGRAEEAARLTLTFGPRPVTGDVNGDELVNSLDFEIIRQNFYQSFSERADGDLVNNDFIDFDDYAQWKQAPKDTEAALLGEQAVPEPGSVALLLFASMAGFKLWRR